MQANLMAGLGSLVLALVLLYGVIWGDLSADWSWQGYAVLVTALFLLTFAGKILYDSYRSD